MADKSPRYIIGTDTGGTFTDVTVLGVDGEVFVDKAPSTPRDFSKGVLDAVERVARVMGLGAEELLGQTIIFKHGSTVGTNALITRDGARVGLITTRGFEDTTLIMRAIGRVAGLGEEEIKRQAACTKPEPVVPRERIYGISERIDYSGKVIIPLNTEETRGALRRLIERDRVEAVAVNLLFGYVNPVHEKRIREMFEEMYPGSDVSLICASDICKTIREYARSNTVILNAFLDKTVRSYVGRLDRQLRDLGQSGPLLIMQANGGAVLPDEVIPIGTVNSGPCGGMIAGRHMANILGHENVITTDMGGTSFDVGVLVGGHWRNMLDPIVERFHISWPMLDITSIGAGGGTIARVDAVTGQLLVGPKSAGAEPGPACYDHGGEEVTVSDADLVLGFLNPDYFLGGRMRLNKKKAEELIEEKIARPLGLSAMEAASGIYQIINSHMADLIRRKVVTTGHVPEEFVIYAFGGAGPVHAAAYGSELGAEGIYVFPTSAVFSSFGVASADIIVSHPETFNLRLPCDPRGLNDKLKEVELGLRRAVERQGVDPDKVTLRRIFSMRYVRQLSEIDVPVPVGEYSEADIESIMGLFERYYEEIYGPGAGYRQAGIELVSFTLEAVGSVAKPAITRASVAASADPGHALKGQRRVFFPEVKDFVTASIFDYQRLLPGNEVRGPSIIETPVTTIVVPPGARAEVDPYLTVKMTLG